LQFGPKGSYRSNSNVDFYKWLVPEAACVEEETLYLSDWFAPNVKNEARI